MAKHSGNTRTKKQARRVAAKARQEEWDKLSPTEKQQKAALNKSLYDYYHKS